MKRPIARIEGEPVTIPFATPDREARIELDDVVEIEGQPCHIHAECWLENGSLMHSLSVLNLTSGRPYPFCRPQPDQRRVSLSSSESSSRHAAG